jgi:hypothetical protein
MSSTIPLRLTVELQPSDLEVRLENPTDHPVRVWDLANSWGRLVVGNTAAATLGRERVLRPNKQPYTANVPRFIEVPAHEQREILLAPSGLEWTFGEDRSALQGTPLDVRVVLDVAPSLEAVEHRVAIGLIESAKVMSQPPHSWLFRAPTNPIDTDSRSHRCGLDVHGQPPG